MDSVYVDELGKTMSEHEMVKRLVLDMLVGAIDVDWREFFPYLYWDSKEKFQKEDQAHGYA